MNMRKLTAVAAFAAGSPLSAAVPTVSDVTMSQDTSRRVTITYTLADAPAVVTLDIQTNATVNGVTTWASIGGENIQRVTGDVWKQIETGSRTIKWRPDLSWPNHKIEAGGAKAVVTAWALDNTPDYMVVDLSMDASDNRRYYPAVEFLPGGLFGDDAYRMTKLVMRKIMAADVTWTMGSTTREPGRGTDEDTHEVALTNNYYIGVFEVTRTQWDLFGPRSDPSWLTNAAARAMRPVDQVYYNEIRNSPTTVENAAHNWPAAPHPDSFLGKLRTKTRIDFDLPSEAQWEFAARAGNGDKTWGDRSEIKSATVDANLARLGRYKQNGGYLLDSNGYRNIFPDKNCGPENAAAIVGSYAPNSWGLYDMHGNVGEWCLDWYEANISAYGGKVNIDPTNPANTLSGNPPDSKNVRVLRGGCWESHNASECRPAKRGTAALNAAYPSFGFRLLCTAGLR